MKKLWLPALLFTMSAFIACQQKMILNRVKLDSMMLISPIDHQEMFAGSRLMCYLSAVSEDLEHLEYQLIKPTPSFVSITIKDHIATIIVDAPQDYYQKILIRLQVKCKDRIQQVSIPVIIKKPKATVYYCDPIHGQETGDGSKSHPWKTLESVFNSQKSFNGNDLILLMSGEHGNIRIDQHNDKPVYIYPASQQAITLSSLICENASNWVISSLNYNAVLENKDLLHRVEYIKLDKQSSNISIENSRIYSVFDSKSWQKEDWYSHCVNGITVFGNNNIVYFFVF